MYIERGELIIMRVKGLGDKESLMEEWALFKPGAHLFMLSERSECCPSPLLRTGIHKNKEVQFSPLCSGE